MIHWGHGELMQELLQWLCVSLAQIISQVIAFGGSLLLKSCICHKEYFLSAEIYSGFSWTQLIPACPP